MGSMKNGHEGLLSHSCITLMSQLSRVIGHWLSTVWDLNEETVWCHRVKAIITYQCCIMLYENQVVMRLKLVISHFYINLHRN